MTDRNPREHDLNLFEALVPWALSITYLGIMLAIALLPKVHP